MVNFYMVDPATYQQADKQTSEQQVKGSHDIELTTWRSSMAIEEATQEKINYLRSKIFSFLANFAHMDDFSEDHVDLFRNYVNLRGECNWVFKLFPAIFCLC